MPQSSVIAAYLVVGFIVYVISKGELPKYKAVLFGPTSGSGTAAGGGSAAGGSAAKPTGGSAANPLGAALSGFGNRFPVPGGSIVDGGLGEGLTPVTINPEVVGDYSFPQPENVGYST